MFFVGVFVAMLLAIEWFESREAGWVEPEPLVKPYGPRWPKLTKAGYKPPRRWPDDDQ